MKYFLSLVFLLFSFGAALAGINQNLISPDPKETLFVAESLSPPPPDSSLNDSQVANPDPAPPKELKVASAKDPCDTKASKKSKKGSSKHREKHETRPVSPADVKSEMTTPNAKASLQTPRESASSESKTIYAYMPDAIYRLYGAPLHMVDVQLQPGETITGKVAAGDTVRWTVGVVTSGAGNTAIQHILIKPIEPNLETNFIITTDRHSYHLAAKSGRTFYIPTIGWTYPQEEMARLQVAKAESQRLEDQIASPLLKAENLNFKYTIEPKDSYPWTPLRVFDDGQKTYLQMNPQMKNYAAPVLFIKGDEGLNLVNYRVKGDFFVVDRLFNEAELRSGKKDMVRIAREKKGFWPWSK